MDGEPGAIPHAECWGVGGFPESYIGLVRQQVHELAGGQVRIHTHGDTSHLIGQASTQIELGDFRREMRSPHPIYEVLFTPFSGAWPE